MYRHPVQLGKVLCRHFHLHVPNNWMSNSPDRCSVFSGYNGVFFHFLPFLLFFFMWTIRARWCAGHLVDTYELCFLKGLLIFVDANWPQWQRASCVSVICSCYLSPNFYFSCIKKMGNAGRKEYAYATFLVEARYNI